MTTSFAERIRAIALNPTPAALAELLPLATQVGRIEAVLDEWVTDAMDSAVTYVEQSLALERAREATRRRGRMKVVT